MFGRLEDFALDDPETESENDIKVQFFNWRQAVLIEALDGPFFYLGQMYCPTF